MRTPTIDFTDGCVCPACELGKALWYGDEHDHPRVAWEKFWEGWRNNWMSYERPCNYQLNRFRRLGNH